MLEVDLLGADFQQQVKKLPPLAVKYALVSEVLISQNYTMKIAILWCPGLENPGISHKGVVCLNFH